MNRRRPTRQTVELSLFPFLAVLICTMGALIVLFVVLVLQARTDAGTVDLPALSVPVPTELPAQEPVPPSSPQVDYREQMAELEKLRAQRLAQLEDIRLQLSGLEDHSHRLTHKIRQLRGEIAVLEGETTNVTGSADDVETQKQRLRAEIAQAEAELEKLREEIQNRKPAYALIPYDGQSGTRRQPIYIECTADRVIIQPEGIGLTGNDFLPPLGPGNPLASALRTVREYRQSQGIPGQGNPYPLLVVRPGGAESYAAAREALEGWDDEFGYELVDDETKLAYPPSDRFLAKRLIETVELARRRKLALIMAAPKRYGRVEDQYLVASRGGGFQSASGSGNSEAFLENRFVHGAEGDSAAPEGLDASGGSGRRSDPTGESLGGSGYAGTGQATNTDLSLNASQTRETGPGFYPQQAPQAQQQDGPQSGAQGSQYTEQPAGPNQPNAQGGNGGSRASMDPMAAKRGANWALPDAAPRSTGISRPMALVASGTQMTLVPERGTASPAETVPVEGNMEAAADKLVRLVQSRIESWGIAGRNFYWKPVLEVTVEPGGEPTLRQLETLLYRSGIEEKRK